MIKAVFMDIDGTLVSMKTHDIPDGTWHALHALKKKGIKLYIASGRPPVQLQLLSERFREFPWDGFVLMNGQYVMDAKKNPAYDLPIDNETLREVVDWLKANADYPVTFMELDYTYDIMFNPGMHEYLSAIGRLDQMPPIDDPERALSHKTYQICPYIPPKDDEEFLCHAPGLKSARWIDAFADMIPIAGGKPEGIKKVLEMEGIAQEECMACGDGNNDLSMLAFAGIGVAMGNGSDEAKKAADYVTDTCENDGLMKAFMHFSLIDERDIINPVFGG